MPQGSILGPLLFLLYMNDFENVSSSTRQVLFADDTTIMMSHTKQEELNDLINFETKNISTWFKANKLSFNLNKTHYIAFKNLNKLSIEIDGTIIKEVTDTKFLGVLVDKGLSWKQQISHIEMKISKGVGILSHMKNLVGENSLLLLYNSLVLPYLDYCLRDMGQYKCFKV